MRNLKVVALCGLVAMVAASPASGAQTIGQTAPSAAAAANCGGPTLYLTPAAGEDAPSYAVPAGGGVITSWSVQGSDDGASVLKLKVVREVAADTYRIVGADPDQRGIRPGILETFDVRIPVAGDDLVGLWVPEGIHACQFAGVAGDVLAFRIGSYPEPAIGDDVTVNTFGGGRLNVSAALEPDADGDGFGDETQDQCPTQATTMEACDLTGPSVRITKGAPKETDKSKVEFKFRSSEAGSTFECKKDKKPWESCTSPTKMKRLDEGKHKFKVRATDPAGNIGKAAKDKFKVVG